MNDLVQRLRNMPLSEACGTMDEAAARIEALEAALREIKDQYLEPNQSSAIAKAALAPPSPPGMHKFTDANGPDE